MTTGDLKNNLRKLQCELKAINYTHDVDFVSLGNGNTADFLPIYHYVFNDYSRLLSAKIVEMNVEMFGKTDLRFMEAVYKVLGNMFTYKPPVTKLQFFAPGFGERKVIMCTQVLQLMRVKHQSLLQSTKAASGRRRVAQPSNDFLSSAASVELSSKTSPRAASTSDCQATGETSPGVVTLVVNEVRSARSACCANGDTAACRDSDDEAVLPTVACSMINEDRQRQLDDAFKNTLLEAFAKINDSVEQISSKLGTLDRRLARIESLEQQLARINHIESRIGDVEEKLSSKLPAAELSGHEWRDSDSMTLVTGQLNNLVARMTLVENKLVILQSAELQVTAAAETAAERRLPNSSPALSSSTNLGSDTNDCDKLSFDVQPTDVVDVVSVSDSYAEASVASQREDDPKVTRSEQLGRIEAMLRGTEAMLTASSSTSIARETTSSPILT